MQDEIGLFNNPKICKLQRRLSGGSANCTNYGCRNIQFLAEKPPWLRQPTDTVLVYFTADVLNGIRDCQETEAVDKTYRSRESTAHVFDSRSKGRYGLCNEPFLKFSFVIL